MSKRNLTPKKLTFKNSRVLKILEFHQDEAENLGWPRITTKYNW